MEICLLYRGSPISAVFGSSGNCTIGKIELIRDWFSTDWNCLFSQHFWFILTCWVIHHKFYAILSCIGQSCKTHTFMFFLCHRYCCRMVMSACFASELDTFPDSQRHCHWGVRQRVCQGVCWVVCRGVRQAVRWWDINLDDWHLPKYWLVFIK